MTTPPPGPTPLPTPASPVGRMLGPWRLESQLGEGATSTVWAATDPARNLRVALKVLKSDEVDEAIAQRRQLRMMRESEALVRSAHPNVVRIVEVGRVGARVYLAMELIQGVDLRTWLSQRRAWPEVVSVYLQCARGLAAAHKAGIIHRDFKPANVMLEHTGRAVVTDFGLARGEVPELEGGALAIKLTAGGVAVGTPRYMAPEQHQAAPTDGRTDQLALGGGIGNSNAVLRSAGPHRLPGHLGRRPTVLGAGPALFHRPDVATRPAVADRHRGRTSAPRPHGHLHARHRCPSSAPPTHAPNPLAGALTADRAPSPRPAARGGPRWR